MNTSLTTVSFHGATLIAQRGATPAETLVAMKPVVEGMGLSWQGQHAKIVEHPVLSATIKEIVMVAEDGKQRLMTTLPLSRLGFWLATIHPNKVPDEDTRARVIAYQMECADALFAHFFSKTTAAKVRAPKAVPLLPPELSSGSDFCDLMRSDERDLRRILKNVKRKAMAQYNIPEQSFNRYLKERYKGQGTLKLRYSQLIDAIKWVNKRYPT